MPGFLNPITNLIHEFFAVFAICGIGQKKLSSVKVELTKTDSRVPPKQETVLGGIKTEGLHDSDSLLRAVCCGWR
jgi:hypothetical protein